MFALSRRGWFRKTVIFIFAVPLMFLGGSFIGAVSERAAGRVGSIEIPRFEFLNRYNQVAESYRRRYDLDEIPNDLGEQIAAQVQGQLLREYLWRAAAREKGIEAPDTAVAAAIRDIPDFQEDGEFSVELYTDYVRDSFNFEREIRRSLDGEPLQTPSRAFVPPDLRTRLAQFRRQSRIVSEAVVTVTTGVQPSEQEIQNYYRVRRGDYQIRERADFEYVVFRLQDVSATVEVSDDEIAEAYEFYLDEGEERQGRRASHIYLGDAAQADEIAERAKADPDSFADLAREFSEDAGSAGLGGDLGFIARGDFPVAMEEAVFQMEEGEVRGPVEVEGGFSVIKLDELAALPPPPLSEVRAEMTERARDDKAQDPWLEAAEVLRDIAYVEVGSLASVAAAIPGGELATLSEVSRNPRENDPPFDAPEALIEVFAPAVVRDGENSPPIPIGEDAFLFARAANYQAPRARDLEEVRDEIAAILRGAAAARALRAELAALAERGESYVPPEGVEWGDDYSLSLADRDGLPEDKREFAGEIFRADLNRGLPAFSVIEGADHARVFRIDAVVNGEAEEEDLNFVDDLLRESQERIAAAAYFQFLSRSVDHEFYEFDPSDPYPLSYGVVPQQQ